MKLIGITYKHNEIEDEGTFRQLPRQLQNFLEQVNGLIAYKGGLHIRGCCYNPAWHSINEVWIGKYAFWKHYPDILDTDIPFAQDCMADQFFLRNEKIIKLYAENGEVESLNIDFTEFLSQAEKDPVNFLGMHPIFQLESEGNTLQPGEILHAYPPFCLNQAGVTIKSIPMEEQYAHLFQLSKQIRKMNDEDSDGVNFIVG